jgi:hypothetical protein
LLEKNDGERKRIINKYEKEKKTQQRKKETKEKSIP